MMPTDCSVLRTITILPNIRISRELSRFYAHIEFRSSSKYDAYGLFRAAHYHNPTQYSHIAGIIPLLCSYWGQNFLRLRCLRIVSCCALSQSYPIFAYRGNYPAFMLILSSETRQNKMPADCFVLRTLTILPNIRISRESSRFYAHIGAGPKVFRPLMSKLMWA